jgi:hypothetical protein
MNINPLNEIKLMNLILQKVMVAILKVMVVLEKQH